MSARFTILTALLATTVAACNDRTDTLAPSARGTARSAAGDNAVGGVFTTTNSTSGNAVVAFTRAADGSLTPLGTYPTGGVGIGGSADPLQSQFALVLSKNARLLFVANAGSDDISVFRVSRVGLTLVDRKPSNGDRPTSVAVSKSVVYVLNAGSNTVTVFDVGEGGTLTPRPADTRPLGSGTSGAAAIRVSPDGHLVAVTGRASNTIDTYIVAPGGSLSQAVTSPASGLAPFGFDFTTRGQIITSDAGSGSASSYETLADGSLRPVSAAVSTGGQRAPCWLIVGNGGRFAYTANAGSATISGYAIGADGSLTLLTPGGATGTLGAGAQPLDLDVSRDGRFLYVFENGTGTIGAFAVNGDGTLTAMPDTPGIAARGGWMGLAAY